MAYGLPVRGQRDWDDELNNSVESLRGDVQSAVADAASAKSNATTAITSADAAKAEAALSAQSAATAAAAASAPTDEAIESALLDPASATAAVLAATRAPLLTAAPGSADGLSEGVHIPAPTGDAEMLLDTANVSPDGVKFFTIIKAAGRITTPLDTYYAYVAGHDGTAIWLVTAPTPAGPWTYRQSVVTATSSTLLTGHVSSPHAIWWGGRMILYVHGEGPVPGQPSVAFTSTDGVTFTGETMAFPNPGTSDYPLRHDASSASYVRVVDGGGYLAAVYQANNSTTMDDPAGEIATSVGFATSTDGLTWRMSPVPLIANPPGERGPYGPGLFRINGMWALSAFEPSRAVVTLWVADRLEPGRFRRYSEWFTAPGGGFDWVDCPVTFWDNGTMHLYYGATDATYTVKGRIRHATIDWSL